MNISEPECSDLAAPKTVSKTRDLLQNPLFSIRFSGEIFHRNQSFHHPTPVDRGPVGRDSSSHLPARSGVSSSRGSTRIYVDRRWLAMILGKFPKPGWVGWVGVSGGMDYPVSWNLEDAQILRMRMPTFEGW